MISALHYLKNARPNLKITNGFERFQGISSGTALRCNKNDTQSDTKQGKDEKTKKNQPSAYPEEPSICCMSGCANCVWLEYAEKLTEYYKDGGEQAVKEIEEKVTDPNIKAFLMHELRMRDIKPK